MTAMTMPWAKRDFGGWAIPKQHRSGLYDAGRPPAASLVWIAPCSHDDRRPGTPAYGLRYRLIRLDHLYGTTPTGIVLPGRPGYGAALSAGNLAALVFGHTYDPMIKPQVGFDGVLGVALQQIWPSRPAPVDFPRGIALDYYGFNMLIKALEPWQ